MVKTLTDKEFYSKVYGCWMGKNIGGTLGGPLEGKMELLDLDFYVQNLNGTPMENDDLDLQLLNLHVVEQYGVQLTTRHIAQEWLAHVFFFMDEYALFTTNARLGVNTPLNGRFNNEFIDCMGSPIRSEIWAVMAAGMPDVAAYYAYQDATVDHAGGEGVYGEVFLAALESMAFYESDIKTLINRSLPYIPENCITAKAVKDIVDFYDSGISWKETRQKLIDSYGTDNFCFAPLNIAFTILGLLYGNNFSECLLIATNCGYDTDCTAATAGSILGIIGGVESIDEKWIKPIGTSIKTCPEVNGFRIPKDLEELTERSIKVHNILKAFYENCTDKSVFSFDYDVRIMKYCLPACSHNEYDLLVTQRYADDHPAIARNGKKEVIFTIENKMSVAYCGAAYLTVPGFMKCGEAKRFELQPGESTEYRVVIENDGTYAYNYPCTLNIERYIGITHWMTEKIDFALIPTKNWAVSKNGGEKQSISCPGDRIEFEQLFTLKAGDVVTAEAEIEYPHHDPQRLMVHSEQPVTLELDGKVLFEDRCDPYLPAYHRVCPDAKLDITAGKHHLKITAKIGESPIQSVAFQTVSLQQLFCQRSILLPELNLRIEAK